jgi:hypothetical protein
MNIVFLGPPAKRPKDSQVLAGWIEDGLSTTTRSPIGDLGAEFDLAEGELAQSQAGNLEQLRQSDAHNKRPPEGGLFCNPLNWRSYLKTDGVDVDVER